MKIVVILVLEPVVHESPRHDHVVERQPLEYADRGEPLAARLAGGLVRDAVGAERALPVGHRGVNAGLQADAVLLRDGHAGVHPEADAVVAVGIEEVDRPLERLDAAGEAGVLPDLLPGGQQVVLQRAGAEQAAPLVGEHHVVVHRADGNLAGLFQFERAARHDRRGAVGLRHEARRRRRTGLLIAQQGPCRGAGNRRGAGGGGDLCDRARRPAAGSSRRGDPWCASAHPRPPAEAFPSRRRMRYWSCRVSSPLAMAAANSERISCRATINVRPSICWACWAEAAPAAAMVSKAANRAVVQSCEQRCMRESPSDVDAAERRSPGCATLLNRYNP